MRKVRPVGRDSLEAMLDRQLTAFDEVMAEVRGGVRSAGHYDSLEERSDAIADGIKAAFRKCQARRAA